MNDMSNCLSEKIIQNKDINLQLQFVAARLFNSKKILSLRDIKPEIKHLGMIIEDDGRIRDLTEFSDEEVTCLYVREYSKLQLEVEMYSENSDASMLKRYLLMDTWSLTQAICLWCGIDPKNSDDLCRWAANNSRLSPRAADIAERWELIQSALGDNTLRDPINSENFIRWASKKERLNSRLFESKICSFGFELTSESKILELNTEIERLKEEVNKLETAFRDPSKVNLATMSRILGAVCKHLFDLNNIEGSKSGATKIVTALMTDEGWRISDRQVRTYLKVASKSFSPGDARPARCGFDE